MPSMNPITRAARIVMKIQFSTRISFSRKRSGKYYEYNNKILVVIITYV